jgi:hypothetical protein
MHVEVWCLGNTAAVRQRLRGEEKEKGASMKVRSKRQSKHGSLWGGFLCAIGIRPYQLGKRSKTNTWFLLQVFAWLIFLGFSFPAVSYAASIAADTANAVWTPTSVTVPVTFTPAGGSVSSINFTMTFDATRFSVSSVVAGDVATAASKQVDFNSVDSSTVKVVAYGLNATAMGGGVLVRVGLAIRADAQDGASALALSSVVSAAPDASSVLTTATGGTLSLDKTAPVVTITAPVNNSTVSSPDMVVTGTVNDPSITVVKVNGADVSVTGGSFSKSITLSEGDNVITVIATDGAGNASQKIVTVTFLLGDVNADGVVNAADVSSVKDQLLGRAVFSQAADLDGDGIITSVDIQRVINRTL